MSWKSLNLRKKKVIRRISGDGSCRHGYNNISGIVWGLRLNASKILPTKKHLHPTTWKIPSSQVIINTNKSLFGAQHKVSYRESYHSAYQASDENQWHGNKIMFCLASFQAANSPGSRRTPQYHGLEVDRSSLDLTANASTSHGLCSQGNHTPPSLAVMIRLSGMRSLTPRIQVLEMRMPHLPSESLVSQVLSNCFTGKNFQVYTVFYHQIDPSIKFLL